MGSEIVKIAKLAALEAGRIQMNLFGKALKRKYKTSASDFSTQADTESEKIIIKTIQKKFPNHQFLSEEIGLVGPPDSAFCWVIDPLDGTISYSNGLPWFGVSIALLNRKQPEIGVIYLPFFNELFAAQKAQGATLNNKKIFVSKKEDLKNSIVGFEVGHLGERKKYFESILGKLSEKVGYLVSYACTCAGCALVACGRLDAYSHTDKPYIWDIAAGAVIINEAGGKVSQLNGRDFNWIQTQRDSFWLRIKSFIKKY